MNWFRNTLFFLLITSHFTLKAANPDTVYYFSLQQALEFGVKNNSEVQNALLNIDYAEKGVKEVRANGLPQINGQISYQNFPSLPVSLIPAEFFGGTPGTFEELRFGTPHNARVSVTASQLIFDSRFFVGLQAADVYTELRTRELEQSEIDTRNKIAKAYYATIITEENLLLLTKSLKTVNNVYDQTRELFKNGFVEEIEVDRLKLSVTNLETQISNLTNQRGVVYDLLKFQMGIDINDSIVVTDKLEILGRDAEALLSMEPVIDKRIEYQILSLQRDLVGLNIRNLESGYLPSVSLFASVEESAQRNEFNFFDFNQSWYRTVVWGVNMQIPIFDGMRKSAQVQQARIRLQMLDNSRDLLGNSILLDISSQTTAYRNALDQIIAQKQNLALAEKIFNTTVIKYNAGVGSSLEVTNAEATLLQTQWTYIGALYGLITARTDLERSLGLN